MVARSGGLSDPPRIAWRRMRAEIRTSMSGWAAKNRCSRGMSQRAANEGATLTVS
jgi:hypothetical protein